MKLSKIEIKHEYAGLAGQVKGLLPLAFFYKNPDAIQAASAVLQATQNIIDARQALNEYRTQLSPEGRLQREASYYRQKSRQLELVRVFLEMIEAFIPERKPEAKPSEEIIDV